MSNKDPLLSLDLKDETELYQMLRDYFFSRNLHEHIILEIDAAFTVQKEKDSFSCQQKKESGKIRVDFATHPQTFLKTVMHGQLSSCPILRIYDKKL